ncbi:MAG: hypothetical protein H8E44_46885 [Planctomycetes bacterium]|nr:hypothetical protein [Planctomycetota bacterium]
MSNVDATVIAIRQQELADRGKEEDPVSADTGNRHRLRLSVAESQEL